MADAVLPYKEKLWKMLADHDLVSLSSFLDITDAAIAAAPDDVRVKTVRDIADIINDYAKTLFVPTDPRFQILGFSGEGGKGIRTYNISTIACIIAALLFDEVKIVKSGSKKNTSTCGSFDFLNYLGIHSKPDEINVSLANHNIAFIETVELYRFLPIFFKKKNALCAEIFKRTIFNEVKYTYKILGLNNYDHDAYIHKYSGSGIKRLCLLSSMDKDHHSIIDELLYGFDITMITYEYVDNHMESNDLDLYGSSGILLQEYVLAEDEDTLEQRKRFLESIIAKDIDMEDKFMKTILLNVGLILCMYNDKSLMENFDRVRLRYLESNNIQQRRKSLLDFYVH